VASQVDVDFNQIQHIVIDGGSEDGTREFLAKTASRLGYFEYKSEKDEGIYHAMNKGIFSSKGKYIQFLNSGDYFSDKYSLRSFIDRAPEVGSRPKLIISGAMLENDDESLNRIRNLPHNWLRHCFGIQPHCHQAMLFDSNLCRSIGGYSANHSFAADFELIVRVGLLSNIVQIDKALVIYKSGGISYQRKGEIPLLLHRIRTETFSYGPLARKVDYCWMLLLNTYRFLISRKKVSDKA
jgi:glycosyltransferase involved in cell wall biosynthesis